MDFRKMTIKQLASAYRSGELEIKDVARHSLTNIQENDGDTNSFVGVYSDIDEQVEAATKKLSEQPDNLLAGIPTGFKDNILYDGQKVSAASKMLENYTATYDSFVSKQLKEQGALVMGRTNMDEFAMGSSTEYSAYGPTKNPLDLERVPGGTSGGSAAAVAGDFVTYALGTDTAGSVRQPASFCGVVGMKPTYGGVSRSGIIAMGSSLDQVGPITKTVEDAEIVFNAIAGHDPMDGNCRTNEQRLEHRKADRVKKIGVPRAFLDQDGIGSDVHKNFDESLERLKGLGYEIVDIDLPNIHLSLPVYYIVLPAEVSTNLSRYDGVRFGRHVHGDNLWDTYKKSRSGFGAEARRRIVMGTYVLSEGYYDAYYGKATRLRDLITHEIETVFGQVDLIVTPTTPTEAFKFGEKADPVSMYAADLFTVPANITGVPALSVPSGVGENKMPLGLQFMAPHFNEHLMFEAGKKFESTFAE